MTRNKTEKSLLLSEFQINLSQNIQSLDISIKAEPHAHVAVGDAHGNWYKLIHNALSVGTVSSHDPEFLQKLRLIYDELNIAPLTLEQFKNYLALLKTCSLKSGIKDIFLGDTRCDRGQNDILTLAWFSHLHEKNSKFRIVFSNHDFDGVRPKAYFYEEFEQMTDFEKLFHLSRVNMDQFLNANQDNIELINLYQHYEDVYNQHLVLIDYTVTTEKTLILYTHAGCGMETIEALASKYDVSYNESTIEDLVNTINQINIKFKQDLSGNFNWELLRKNNPNDSLKIRSVV